jgi:C4-dicarboxylate-specific signal transduction histidine kinase
MKIDFDNFLSSGLAFGEDEWDLKNRFQMINITIVLASIGLLYGIMWNVVRETPFFIPLEMAIMLINFTLLFILRRDKQNFFPIATFLTAEFTFLFLFLFYKSDPASLKHVWLLSYPIMLLYFQGTKRGIFWVVFVVSMLLIAPLQPFVEVQYSFFQSSYVIVVFLIITLAIYFYQLKMDESRALILSQQNLLRDFNGKLEKQVRDKTLELTEMNVSLEEKVKSKIEELLQKDKILTVQSKQAVMGEMISMIAHQWRQPLSTITLQISNLELQRLLGEAPTQEEISKTLSEISDTIIYLSETIDDFKTYFHPNKELAQIEIHELLEKAVNFVSPRLKDAEVVVCIKKEEDIHISTYPNELLQVILNLLNNAIDVFAESKNENAKVILAVRCEDDQIIVSAQDNATGISEQNLPHIFEPYFSTKGKNGTGLGLYMSQMIIEKQFGGTISVVTSSEGSTFSVKISQHIS